MSSENNHSKFTILRYYKKVPVKEFLKLKEFRDSHPLKTINYKNNEIEYSRSGNSRSWTYGGIAQKRRI